MSEEDLIVTVNNYCVSNHTMKKKTNRFVLKSYDLVKKSLFCETFCLTNENNFKYELWLTRE